MKNFMAMAAMALAFTACTPGANNQSAFTSVSVEQFAADIANPQVQLVDVRTPGEHAAGSIPGRGCQGGCPASGNAFFCDRCPGGFS